MLVNAYCQALHQYLPNKHWFLYWMGRVGPGDEVIVPGFTCVVVPNAILYLGATPVYVDIDPAHYTVPVAHYEAALTQRTKVMITQNTFGLSVDVEAVAALGASRGVWTIDDCTHGFGGTMDGRPNGHHGDAAFFSTQWNKPFSTGIGGMVATHHPDIISALGDMQPVSPTRWAVGMLWAQIMVRRYLPMGMFWLARDVFRWLSRHRVVVGSSTGEELTGPTMPPHYFMGMSRVQMNEGLRALAAFPAQQAQRQQTARVITDWLCEHGKTAVPDRYHANHAFLCYPLLVQDVPAYAALARRHGMPLGDWFASPIHPVVTGLDRWGLCPEEVPCAMAASQQLVNLPTHGVCPDRILAWLNRTKSMIV